VKRSSEKTTLRTSKAQLPPREAPITHPSGLLIYLKHRGTLNIDEFRRTNARGQ
jgi:hypothetical protein